MTDLSVPYAAARPHLQVACAILRQNNTILAVQRAANMRLPLKWEFPGGKIEAGETAEDCLVREVVEELGVRISVGAALSKVTYSYRDFTVTLHPFLAEILSGTLVLHEHAAARWLAPHELQLLDWAEADLPILTELQQLL